MSEERVQISMSNTKKEMLEAYEALLAEVQAKSLENPKEEQKRVSEQKVVAQAEALSVEELDAFAREVTGGFERSVTLLQSQLKEAGVKVANSEETVRDIALRAIDSSTVTSRTLAREPRMTATRDTEE